MDGWLCSWIDGWIDRGMVRQTDRQVGRSVDLVMGKRTRFRRSLPAKLVGEVDKWTKYV